IPAARASAGERNDRAASLIAIVPRSGGKTPGRIFTSVLLPAPLAPISAWTSPGRTLRLAERSATTEPNLLAMSRASRRFAALFMTTLFLDQRDSQRITIRTRHIRDLPARPNRLAARRRDTPPPAGATKLDSASARTGDADAVAQPITRRDPCSPFPSRR